MSSVDILFGVVLGVFILVGIWKGFFREILGLAGILGGVFLGIVGFGILGKILNNAFPAIPAFLWPFLSFILIFVGVYLASRLLAALLSKLSESLFLGWLNRLLGGLVGGLKGVLLISLVLLLLGFLPFQNSLQSVKQKSMLYAPLQGAIPSLYNLFSGFSFSSQNFELKVVSALENTSVKLNDEIINYLFYGKQTPSPNP